MPPPKDPIKYQEWLTKMHAIRRTDEQKRKQSESMKGKPAWNKGMIMLDRTGEKNPWYGKTLPEETRKKMSDSWSYEKHFTEETCKKISIANKGKLSGSANPNFGKHKSEEEKKRISDKLKGERGPNWRGGIGYLPYCPKFNRKRKKAVRDFFGNLCICTGEPDSIYTLNVHHVDHDKEQGCNGRPFNLVPMNDYHHGLEVHKQKEYQDYINKTLREGFKWGIWNEEEYVEKVMYDE